MDIHVYNLWEKALATLEDELDRDSFSTWLSPTVQRSFDDSTLVIAVPSAVACNWLSTHYKDRISEVVERLAQKPVEIEFEVRGNDTPHLGSPGSNGAAIRYAPENTREVFRSARLSDQYSFETFVVGESNRFAHAAARSVADSSKSWNPLFIYGGVGLGKTHLMQAVGHEFLKMQPAPRVLYVTSEQFMNAFIDSVTQSNAQQFRNFYRNIDLLLIDDVQFFMGKEGTQTEFFHTFNALYDAGHKIVVTSDRPPKELNNLEERLVSRFEWGLIVDIQPPDLETRIAILRTKAQMHHINLPYDHALFIAERIKSNVRKLEGVIMQMRARGVDDCAALSREELGQFLEPFLVGEEPKRVSLERVSRIVCEYFGVEVDDLKGKSRLRKHAQPRHVAMYLCRTLAGLSFPEIGKFFGSRDHTSVMHAYRKIEGRIEKELNVQNLVTYLTKRIQENGEG